MTSGILFSLLKAIGMLRVSEEEEVGGLDVYEHGIEAYPTSAYGTGSSRGGSSAGSFAPPARPATE